MIRKALPRVLEIITLAIFVLLIYDNARLRKVAANASLAARRPPVPRTFHAGDTITEIQAFDLGGKPQRVSFGEGRSLVAVVDPGCSSCEKVIAALPMDGSAVVLSLAAPAAFHQAKGKEVRGRVYSIDPARRDPRLSTNPQVFLVDQGRVIRTCAEPAGCL